MKSNQDLRDYAKENHIFFWQVAQKMERSESYVSRLLRLDLGEDDRKMIRSIITELIIERNNCSC